MSINANLMRALKKHKFKNKDVITYTTLNNEFDDKTPTDVSNDIYKAFQSSNTKDKLEILNAIFDKEFLVVENTSNDSRKNKFGLVDEKKGEFASLTITQKKDVIYFEAKGTKISIEFVMGTPKTISNSNDWKPSRSKKELIKMVNDAENDSDLEKIRDVLNDMLKTK